jgi:WS/DGAT/MGAT family acyltransferase
MASYRYERLSAQDNSFLLFESPNLPMHVAATLVFKTGPLRTEDGGVDVEAIKRGYDAVLHQIPRYRQILSWIPLEQRAVWIDDAHFNLDYHIRHTSLPRPGTEEQLKRLCARVMEHQLDRARPLWESWIVEGLEGDRFAIIAKVHHCMIDGTSGMGITDILLSLTPEYELPPPPRFIPRPAPGAGELLRDQIWHRLSLPFRAARSVRDFAAETDDLRHEIGLRLRAVKEMVGWAIRSPSETPINNPVGPHRVYDWLVFELDEVKAIRKALECSVNDVVLTTVTGAFREFLRRRQMRPQEVDFRVSAPVNVRRDDERDRMGNQVSSWIIRLPLGLADPREQLDEIRRVTRELKESQQAVGVEMMMKMAEWAPSSLISLSSQAISGPINTIVTNVPGPQFPLYMLGAELVAMYPQAPLLPNLGLATGLISYHGKVCWGFNGDYEQIPDLRSFVQLVRSSFEKLAEIAGVKLAPRADKRARRPRRSAAAERRAPSAQAEKRPEPAVVEPISESEASNVESLRKREG